jgi:hypothetical protein
VQIWQELIIMEKSRGGEEEDRGEGEDMYQIKDKQVSTVTVPSREPGGDFGE